MRKSLTIALCVCCCAACAGLLPAPPVNLAVAPAAVITNKPVVVNFDAWPTNQQYYTSLSYTNTTTLANSVKSNGGYHIFSNATLTVKIWEAIPVWRVTNSMVTCTVGTNRSAALTNFYQTVVTNHGPVTFWLPPTNRYVFTLWSMDAMGLRTMLQQIDWPAAPSNQLRFISTPLFSKNLRDWTVGTNTYTFTVTNGIDYGTNLFVRWSTVAVKDDFTQKAVVFDANTFWMFPTNAP